MEALIIVVLLVLLFVWISIREQQNQFRKKKTALQENFGKAPTKVTRHSLERCKRSFLLYKKEDSFTLDDQTWADLGLDEVLDRLDYTLTSTGEEKLYRILRTPSFEETEISYRQEVLKGLYESTSTEKGRQTFLDLQMELASIGHTGNYSFPEYMAQLETKKEESVLYYLGFLLLYVPGVVLLFWKPLIGVLALFIAMFLNVAMHHRKKLGLNLYLVSFGYLLRVQKAAKALLKQDLSLMPKEAEALQTGLDAMKGFEVLSGLTMSMASPLESSNPMDVLLSYLRMMFHFDLMKFNQMLRIAKAHRDEIQDMVEAIGTLDVSMSMVCFMASLQNGFCFAGKQEHYTMEEGYHPLLQHPVGNSIQVDSEKGILLTGSNASGKSTFLKTMGINALLAQTIGVCTAKSFAGPYVRLVSSMSAKDNLQSGESYYVAEMIGIRRIMDESKKGKVLCFVDEILRGTNTTERIAASTEILAHLQESGVITFAATHDIELTRLLEQKFENYHFCEDYQEEEGQITFSYHLQNGKSETSNAIRLLQNYGYDQGIVSAAKDMVAHFNQTGKWTSRYEK